MDQESNVYHAAVCDFDCRSTGHVRNQLIGWDPSTGKIRSWVFDSDGGFGEATWTKKGNRWIINAAATMPDGRKTSAINILNVLDKNSFTWHKGRELDGEILPNIEPIKVVRNAKTDSK